MNLDIEPASILAGVSLAVIGGWIASLLAFRKDERAVQLEQITKERAKWRDSMRELSEEIAAVLAEEIGTRDTIKVASMRARLATSISPKDSFDREILAHYDDLFSGESGDLKLFVRRISLLLKHDWERVKWECMPLYLKPFLRYTPKQREWRGKYYRDVND